MNIWIFNHHASIPTLPGRGTEKRGGRMKKVCVLGLGYIGLPTAAVLATHGFRVIGV